MLFKLGNDIKQGAGPIKILYPGLAFGRTDTGLGTIGRIDQANLPPGVTIKMHPHVNDEILSYFRSGRVKHTDSVGFTEYITDKRLMLMKAGRQFFHEETVMDDHGSIEGLQIFIRPGRKDLDPIVTFHELSETHSENKWRLMAGPAGSGALQELRSETLIYDMRLAAGQKTALPEPIKKMTGLLYCFQGSARVGGRIDLAKGESVVIKDEAVTVETAAGAELVLFGTDEQSEYFAGGMYSGNQF